ncbi:hypothetical protein D4764_16G0003980 [Takifugu flavidus]|uniref:Uncharacterized protein n=1 Tax=Takifugu flavidus TaxID=433684 RepID=A0A5C6NZ45_9TELE|nr:hypothetical protein D4764_16G0003980 [Takifugu flavidus]
MTQRRSNQTKTGTKPLYWGVTISHSRHLGSPRLGPVSGICGGKLELRQRTPTEMFPLSRC